MGAKTRGNYSYRPNTEVCCEACVFGRGKHSNWCEKGREAPVDDSQPKALNGDGK